AASSTTRARALATRYPASYICWDLLQHPDPAIDDCRSRPYTERRALLLGLLADVGPPIQAVPATDDRDVAVLWYDALREQGIEGIVCKRGSAGYPSGQRRWFVNCTFSGSLDGATPSLEERNAGPAQGPD
ncbi:ATP-dependent DNA ligase, partial [Streptomyces sp. NPDC001880]